MQTASFFFLNKVDIIRIEVSIDFFLPPPFVLAQIEIWDMVKQSFTLLLQWNHEILIDAGKKEIERQNSINHV